MHTPNQTSPMLKAIDLMRVNIDELDLSDIETHAIEVIDTIAALNDYINGPIPKSHNALLNAQQLNRKMCLHMARVRDLINARNAAHAMAQTSHAANMLSMPQGLPAMGRNSRVIRPLKSADNATSGPLEISRLKPQAWGTESSRGGEAKEVEPPDSPAKRDVERSEKGGRRS